MFERASLTLARWIVPVLIIAVSVTACLIFTSGDRFIPHPWSKHAQTTSHPVVKLPPGVETPSTALVAPALFGPLAASASPLAASVTRKPPFVPPRS